MLLEQLLVCNEARTVLRRTFLRLASLLIAVLRSAVAQVVQLIGNFFRFFAGGVRFVLSVQAGEPCFEHKCGASVEHANGR
jgi:hypothetical protein